MPTPRKPRPKPAPIDQPTAATEATPPPAATPRAGLYRDSQTVVMSGRHVRQLLAAERDAQLDEVGAWLVDQQAPAAILAAFLTARLEGRFERD